MPFLYQTRTLTAAFRTTSPVTPYLSDRGAFTQNHCTQYSQADGGSLASFEARESETLDETDGHSGPRIRRTELVRDPLGRRTWKPFDFKLEIPEEMREGHNGTVVRKILVKAEFESSARPAHLGGVSTPKQSRKSNTRQWKSANAEYDEDFDEFENVKDIKFADSGIRSTRLGEMYREKDPIDELAYRHRIEDRKSTITQSERLAFQKLFADVFTRHHDRKDPFDSFVPEKKDPEKTRKANTEIRDLMMGAVGPGMTREQKEQVVSRYPESLRAAAARAIGFDSAAEKSENFLQSSETKEIEEEPAFEVADNQRLESSQNAERQRVETLMQGAKNDFALWAIMEKEVFPLIEKLGLGEIRVENPEDVPKKRGRKSRKSKQAERSPVTTTKMTPLPPTAETIKALQLYGPLYPEHLLFGLRCLANNFAKPSPLTLSVLSKIKSLGFISQALGASTQLYNELLKIYWYKRDDFRGVISLLKEMESSGLDWDAETLDIVEDIWNEQRRVLNGSRGPTLKVLWTFPEFQPGVFSAWSKKIRQALQQRQAENEQLLPY